MPVRSAGLLLYRRSVRADLEVLLVHPGGPLWARKDVAAWSVPKGEYESDEDAHVAAIREFGEELGRQPPDGPDTHLGEFRQPSGKVVEAWAREGDFDATSISSNAFELEWPPRSGRRQRFPEVDRAGWFTLDEARIKLHKGQVPILDALLAALDLSP